MAEVKELSSAALEAKAKELKAMAAEYRKQAAAAKKKEEEKKKAEELEKRRNEAMLLYPIAEKMTLTVPTQDGRQRTITVLQYLRDEYARQQKAKQNNQQH